MEEQQKEIDTAFIVVLHKDGTFRVDLDPKSSKPETPRNPTQYDVLLISQQIVKEIESQDLTNRILGGLIQILSAQAEPSPSDLVKEKLKERGIDPDKEQNPVN
jgi:hypothetical protein